jgi:hypothetical protein
VFVGPYPYDSIHAGYLGAEAGDIIKVTASVQSGDLDLNEDKDVKITGGYDCQFGNPVSLTTVAGSFRVNRGSAEVANVQIK